MTCTPVAFGWSPSAASNWVTSAPVALKAAETATGMAPSVRATWTSLAFSAALTARLQARKAGVSSWRATAPSRKMFQ